MRSAGYMSDPALVIFSHAILLSNLNTFRMPACLNAFAVT
ncbi:hypothetical protein PRUB_b0532 [Pseudoalteromonas rubra]|uniref:Uncharacterized protein n=1 Tax=Pseudoalteromonas rubra TaxID=43658 RepID=A0A8T0BZX4_9GAMM|nr:hypothetical protein PRUB_b0532 [Pseudoalteromonas rubra]